MRIASLFPAATEIVCALGLEDDLVAISHACDFPESVVGRPIVTRPLPAVEARRGPEAALGVRVDERALREVEPDVVLAGAGPSAGDGLLTRVRAAVPDASCVSLAPASVEGTFNAIATVGAMTEAEDEAVGLVELLRERLLAIEEQARARREAGERPRRVAVLRWLDPLHGSGLWIPEVVRLAGGWDVLGREGEPSAETTWRGLTDLDPEVLVIAIAGSHLVDALESLAERRSLEAIEPTPPMDGLGALRTADVSVVDAAYLDRPGPRLVDGVAILAELLDPAGFEGVAPPESWLRLDAAR